MFQDSDTDSDGGNEATPIDDLVNQLKCYVFHYHCIILHFVLLRVR